MKKLLILFSLLVMTFSTNAYDLPWSQCGGTNFPPELSYCPETCFCYRYEERYSQCIPMEFHHLFYPD